MPPPGLALAVPRRQLGFDALVSPEHPRQLYGHANTTNTEEILPSSLHPLSRAHRLLENERKFNELLKHCEPRNTIQQHPYSFTQDLEAWHQDFTILNEPGLPAVPSTATSGATAHSPAPHDPEDEDVDDLAFWRLLERSTHHGEAISDQRSTVEARNADNQKRKTPDKACAITRQAWREREKVRSRVQATWSLEGMQELERTTLVYNKSRSAWAACKQNGELGKSEARHHPVLFARELHAPKTHPPGILDSETLAMEEKKSKKRKKKQKKMTAQEVEPAASAHKQARELAQTAYLLYQTALADR